MIYIIPESLAGAIQANGQVQSLNYQELLDSEIKKGDVIVSNLDDAIRYANENHVTSIFVLEYGYTAQSNKELFNFFTTKKNIKPLCEALGKKNIYNFEREDRVTVMNFIFDKERKRVLLQKRRRPFWGYEPVKGGVEVNESLRDALSRETYEECGLKISSILYEAPEPIIYENIDIGMNRIRHVTAYVFACIADDKSKTSINEEDAKKVFSGSDWIGINEAESKFVLPRYRLAFEYALNGLRKATKND